MYKQSGCAIGDEAAELEAVTTARLLVNGRWILIILVASDRGLIKTPI
jgi:hypothetical protein